MPKSTKRCFSQTFRFGDILGRREYVNPHSKAQVHQKVLDTNTKLNQNDSEPEVHTKGTVNGVTVQLYRRKITLPYNCIVVKKGATEAHEIQALPRPDRKSVV